MRRGGLPGSLEGGILVPRGCGWVRTAWEQPLLQEQRVLDRKSVIGILVFLSLFLHMLCSMELLTYGVLRMNEIRCRASHHGNLVVESAVCVCLSSQDHHPPLTAERTHRSISSTAFSIPVLSAVDLWQDSSSFLSVSLALPPLPLTPAYLLNSCEPYCEHFPLPSVPLLNPSSKP